MKKILLFWLLITSLSIAQGLKTNSDPFVKNAITTTTINATTLNDELITNYQTFPYDKLTTIYGGGSQCFRYYVKSSGSNTDGQTWETAYNQIQTVIDELPNNLNGYQVHIMIAAGDSLDGFSLVGKGNGEIYIRWCGTFVDTATAVGKYATWVRNGSTAPIGSNDQTKIVAVGSDYTIESYSNNTLLLDITAANYNYEWNATGFGYAERIILKRNNNSTGLIALWDADVSFSSVVGILFDMNLVPRYNCALRCTKVTDLRVSILGRANSTACTNSGTQWDGVLQFQQGSFSVDNVGYASGYSKSTIMQFEGMKQIYTDNNVSNSATLYLNNITYTAGHLGTWTPIVRLGTNYTGTMTYKSAEITLTDVSTYGHIIVDNTLSKTYSYLNAIEKNDGTTFTFGNGTAGRDYVISIDGETNDGSLTWMEDENRWQSNDSLYVEGNLSGTTYGRDKAVSDAELKRLDGVTSNIQTQINGISGGVQLGANRTVNLTSSMSAATIQDSINIIPKNLGGKTITFQFGDGTYSLDATTNITGFYNGIIKVLGNSGNNSLSVTKSVKLYYSVGNGLYCYDNTAFIEIMYLDVRVADIAYGSALLVERNISMKVNHCYFHAAAITNGNISAAYISRTNVTMYANMVGLSTFGIHALFCASVYNQGNDDGGAGAQPVYGITAEANGEIGNSSSAAITGSTGNSSYSDGGVIR